MRNPENKHLGIEIDSELHAKLKELSKYYGRSMNGQILFLIRRAVEAYEAEQNEKTGN